MDLGDGNIPLGQWPGGGGTNEIGRMPQTGLNTWALWLAGVLNIMVVGALTTMIVMKRNKMKKHK